MRGGALGTQVANLPEMKHRQEISIDPREQPLGKDKIGGRGLEMPFRVERKVFSVGRREKRKEW